MSQEASPFDSLPGKSSIRVLLLAPGEPDDDICCFFVPTDLDADHELPSSSAPQPIQEFSICVAKTPEGTEREFVLPKDLYIDGQNNTICLHPFQRYAALSYVWGDQSHPAFISLHGNHRFPVTRNLFSALKALRLKHQGRSLWIDALCINQADAEEKAVQIGLMRRVYQQADMVISYIPLAEQDEGSLLSLVSIICNVGRPLYKEARQSVTTSQPVLEPQSVTDVSDMDVTTLSINSIDELCLELDKRHDARVGQTPVRQLRSLEDLDIPPGNSPLWDAWRRFWAAPYFRRIWIFQEFALGRTLYFSFGSKTLVYHEPIMVAQHYMEHLSSKTNLYLTCKRMEDQEHHTSNALSGYHGAKKFFHTRLSRNRKDDKLVDQLRETRFFNATDPRDKIYGLLGLAVDGQDFVDCVSYAPESTTNATFIRFATLFVSKGYAIELIDQAGIRSCDAGLPSWVPNWAKYADSRVPRKNSLKTLTSAEVVNNDSLVLQGVVVDKIQALAEQGFSAGNGYEEIEQFEMDAFDWLHGFAGGINLLTSTTSQHEELSQNTREAFFALLTDSDRLPRSTNPEVRNGFNTLTDHVWSWVMAKRELKETPSWAFSDLPNCVHEFMKRAGPNTVNFRVCTTETGGMGLVPCQSMVGDLVVKFDEGLDYYLLRRCGTDNKDSEHQDPSYRLIEAASFVALSSDTERRDKFTLV